MKVNEETWIELSNIEDGVLNPLTGFLTQKDYQSVLDHNYLTSGNVWTLPVTLEIPEKLVSSFKTGSKVLDLEFNDAKIGVLEVEDIFYVDYSTDLKKIFGTSDLSHPGVKKESSRSPWRVGGKTKLTTTPTLKFPKYSLSPNQIKEEKDKRRWKKLVGFQTRNPLHRAHEYLQRLALELADGLLIQPLVGWKRDGDFTAEAVISAYEVMIEKFYPTARVLLCTLTTSMRYAGPREAVFHALIRKNFGCTHFIIGRDHAGVGGFYGKYEAQNFAKSFHDLGIEILSMGGPYYCSKCKTVVTEFSCSHGENYSHNISGTEMRELFRNGQIPSDDFMRNEVSHKLLEIAREGKLFY